MSIENKGLECLGKRKTVFVWGNSSNKHRLAMIWKIEKYLNWGAVPNYTMIWKIEKYLNWGAVPN